MTTEYPVTQASFVEFVIRLTSNIIRGFDGSETLPPILVLLRPTGQTQIITIERGHPADALGPLLAEHEYIAWATITDAWIAKRTIDNPFTPDEVRAGVRNIPGRGEAIVCAGKHAPTDYRFSITQEYVRTPTGIELVGEVVVGTNTAETLDSPWAFGENNLH